jgi:hypothetical protein
MPIAYKITVKTYPDRLNNVIKSIKDIHKTTASSIYPQVETVKEKVLQALQTYINSHRQRPDVNQTSTDVGFKRLSPFNNLYETIERGSDIVPTTNGWRLVIGKKEFLDAHAPYWYIVNFGGIVPPMFLGYFGAGHKPSSTYGRKEAFTRTRGVNKTNPFTTSKKSFLMIPEKPITPMYYINYMAKVFEQEMKKIKVTSKKKM